MIDITTSELMQRRIKSFVLRTGRFSSTQKEALARFWSKYGVDFQPQKLDFTLLFPEQKPVILEIGFGMGHSLVKMAQQNQDYNYLGIEVHPPGIGNCLNLIAEAKIKNIKIMQHDAIEVLNTMINDNSLTGLQLFFPDPWHKRKHHKRRIVNQEFIQLVVNKLQVQGFIHMATDWQNYAEYMLASLRANQQIQNITEDYIDASNLRCSTKFENRGIKLGHQIWDLYFTKI